MTKEPKLESAMRIVPEWTSYDSEIKALWEELKETGTHKTQGGKSKGKSGEHIHSEL